MLFNSYIFVLGFLPLCLAGYFLLNRAGWKRAALIFLLGMSLWFYGANTPKYLILIVSSVLVNYGFYRLSAAISGDKLRRAAKLAAVAVNLGVLFYFKYYDFFAETVNSIFRSDWTLRHVMLPLGISFFTFQQISFVVDAFNGEVKDCSLLDYACFVTFFPQLIAGPIVTHDELVPQLQDDSRKRFNCENFARGVYIFAIGLTKKVLIADNLNRAVLMGYSYIAYGSWNVMDSTNCLIVMLSYTLQMYFDFSGYSDMAIGLGRMFGFHFLENFNYPYISLSVTEFWRRWHISLSTWFRDYVYIPLGGNRVSRGKWVRNILVVWGLTGLWHGADWNFLLWGLYYGVLLLIEKLWLGKYLERLPKALRWLLCMVIVCIGWVMFNLTDFAQMRAALARMFSFTHVALSQSLAADVSIVPPLLWMLPALVFSTPVCRRVHLGESYGAEIVRNVVCLALLAVCIVFSVSATFNPFIYFRF